MWLLVSACTTVGTVMVPPTSLDPALRVVAGPLVCEDPGAREALGPWVREEYALGETDIAANAPDMGHGARGLVVADFDVDGHLDVVVPRVSLPTAYLAGTGRELVQIAPPPMPDVVGPVGGSAADHDADGDPDLVLFSQTQLPVLLVNEGGQLDLARSDALRASYAGCGRTASWADVDLDGDLDLYFGRSTRGVDEAFCGSSLFLSDGAGGFTDGTSTLPPEAVDYKVVASGFHQLDADPWPELFLVTGLGGFDAGFDNGPEGWTPLSGTGLEAPVDAMGIGAADLNLDGITDFAVPGIDEILVLVSLEGQPIWIESSVAYGVVPGPGSSVGWGGDFGDLDNDGLLDLVMGYGATTEGAPPDADEIFRGLSPTRFERVGEAWGFADGFSTRGSVVADLNEDGWLDVIKRQVGGIAVSYLSRCGDAHWLALRLRAPAPNPDAVGAWIEVEAHGQRLTRTVSLGSTGFSTGGPPDLHVGLGDADEVDRVVVHWPDGAVTTHGPVETDVRLELLHPDLL